MISSPPETLFARVSSREIEYWKARCLREVGRLDNVKLRLIEEENIPGEELDRRSGLFWDWYIGQLNPIPDFRTVQLTEFVSGDDLILEPSARLEEGEEKVVLDFAWTHSSRQQLDRDDVEWWGFEPEYRKDSNPSGLFMGSYLDGEDTGAVQLVRYDSSGEKQILARSRRRNPRTSYSDFLNRMVHECIRLPAEILAKDEIRANDVVESGMGDPSPSLGRRAIVRFLWREVSYWGSNLLGGLFRHEDWNVGMIEGSAEDLLAGDGFDEVEWLFDGEEDHFRADPFGVNRGDRKFVFHERYDVEQQRGYVDVLERSSEDRIYSDVVPTGSHGSYPFLIEHDREIYCVPERFRSEYITLYRAVEFPEKWEKVSHLVEGIHACDPTIIRYEGRWWLFFTDAELGPHHRLHVWYSDQLQSGWQPHEGNPVKRDVSSSRPAGTPFHHEGKLYRPAQDCGPSYGHAVSINRVDQLSPDQFQETPVNRMPPSDSTYSAGIHTISLMNGNILIDGKRTCFRYREFLRAITDDGE